MTIAREVLLHTILKDGETLLWSEMVDPSRIRWQQFRDVASSTLYHVIALFACLVVAVQLVSVIPIYMQHKEIVRLSGSIIVLALCAPVSLAVIHSLFRRLRDTNDGVERFPIAYGVSNQRLFAIRNDGDIHSSLEIDHIMREEDGTSKSEILVTGTDADEMFIMVMLTDKQTACEAIAKARALNG
ncbi:hypothetical protein [Ponticaulis sp.]|uniref:hypothetical protein n=1 Tax=Ponticaulis sp. TaxID=2020902 RepID=UPI000B6BAD06|nr:hypothetical protein [Ponticaulis sp.]MAJ07981.1 hypothetical protein [Ponticaulis sp.]RPG18290.1 MAG: hypothetical protein CBC85_003410 [Hyphomonadaceae bacterium TMED125]HBH91181.1 hypothetical protein [Hyphomonadaceae bacterium]HBJ92928.1 hypothetical protein [Hyphomonadaceae bacterium]|tara:strand:- start:1977 stop:2534 length:558 start_codon:yes stop_codon:yes gene_type:complete